MSDFWIFLDRFGIIVGLVAVAISTFYSIVNYVLKKNKKIKLLEEIIKENQLNLIREKPEEYIDGFFPNVHEVKLKILSIIKELDSYSEISILNLGLDLDTIVGMIKYDLFIKNEVLYKCLVIDATEPLISDNCRNNISSDYAKANIQKLKSWFEQHKKQSNIKIKIVSYSSLPIVHGFLLNNTHLFIGFTVFEESGLAGGNHSYIYINRNKNSKAKLREDIFKTYLTWFSYLFENGKVEYSSFNYRD